MVIAHALVALPGGKSTTVVVLLVVIAGFDVHIIGVHVGAWVSRYGAQGNDCGGEEAAEKHDEIGFVVVVVEKGRCWLWRS